MQRDEVLEANRRFYDQVAPVYDEIDRRRAAGGAPAWLHSELRRLRENCGAPAPVFVDLGAGTAYLGKAALPYFSRVVAVDLSPAVLERIQEPGIEKICAPCEKLPLPDSSAEVVGAFATLHHLFNPADAFREAYRVLKPGGQLFTDHDIEMNFVRLFRIPLTVYRFFFDHGPRYLRACPQLSARDYELSEFHGESGLDGEALAAELRAIGFIEVEIEYHWQGLLPLTPPWRKKYFSPLLRIRAKKGNS